MWICRYKERFRAQRKSKLMPRANDPFWVLEKDGVGADNSVDLRANPFQQGGYDVAHHRRFGPRSPRKEESKLGSPMVSYKGPITRSRAKFVNLVTHLDDKGAFESLGGNWSRFWHKTSKLKISVTRGGRNLAPWRWGTSWSSQLMWMLEAKPKLTKPISKPKFKSHFCVIVISIKARLIGIFDIYGRVSRPTPWGIESDWVGGILRWIARVYWHSVDQISRIGRSILAETQCCGARVSFLFHCQPSLITIFPILEFPIAFLQTFLPYFWF